MPISSFEMLRNFTEDRPVMKEANSDVSFLLGLLLQEVTELQEEPHGMSKEKYLEQELADVAIFAISILHLITGDADAAIREKVGRNTLKYPARLFQEGSYEDARANSKLQWTEDDNQDFYQEEEKVDWQYHNGVKTGFFREGETI